MRLKLGAGLLLGLLALVLVLHVPFARRAVLGYARAVVQRDMGVTLEAGRLDYNLVALRVGFASVRLSTPGFESEPFFEAEYVSASLPFSAFLGDLAFTDVSAIGARVVVHRRIDGTTNLPISADDPDVEPQAVHVARLDVPRLAIDLRDDQTDSSLQIPALALLLTPSGGTVSLDMPAELRVATRQTHVSHIQGQAQFDGRALGITDVAVLTDEASVTLDGVFEVLTRVPRLDLRLSGMADVAGLARWGLTDTELPQGVLAFDGSVVGPLDDPQAEMDLSAERVTWRGVTTEGLVARVRVDSAAADMETLRARFAEGTVTATATLPFADDAIGHIAASWSEVDVASALSAGIPDLDLVPAAVSSGEIEIDGVLVDAATWSGSLRLQMEAEPNSLGRVSVAGGLRLDVGDGTWRLDGQPTLAGIALFRMEAGGRLGGGRGGLQAPQGSTDRGPTSQQGIGPGTIDGTVRLSTTDVPGLFSALRTIGIATIADDTVTAGTLEADMDVGGRLADPSISVSAIVRGLVGAGVAVASVSARVEGQLIQPRLAFEVETPEGVVAGQRLNDVRAAGLMSGTSILFERLSASQPTGPGLVTGHGAYDLNTGAYSASIDGADWVLLPTAEQPMTGRLSVSFVGSGTGTILSGTGRATLTDARWQDTVLGNLDASVRLDGEAADIDARAPDFDATATARIQLDAPYTARVDARAGRLDLTRVLQHVTTPMPLSGYTSLALGFEGPLDGWRTGAATVDIASLEATAGDLPVHLTQPSRMRYEDERIFIDQLDADAGGTAFSASGALSAFETVPDTAGLLITLTGGVDEVARAAGAMGFTGVPLTGGAGPVALFARLTGSVLAPEVVADLEMGPGSITLEGLPAVTGLQLRAHVEDGWLELREGTASYQDANIAMTARAPLSWLVPGIDTAGAASGGEATVHARATNMTPAVFAPFLAPETLEQLTGSVDATIDATSAALDLSALTGELRFDRLDLRVADLPVTQRVPTRIVVGEGFARVAAWDWVGQGTTLAVQGQVRLEDRQAAILANGVLDMRMLTPFIRDAGMTTTGQLVPRLSVTGALDDPRIDGDLTLTDGEIRLADPRTLVSDLNMRAVLTRTSARIISLTGAVNGGSLTGGGSLEQTPAGEIAVQLSSSIRGMAMEFPEGLRSEIDADLDLALDLRRPSGHLTGTATLVQGTYREPLAVVTGLLAGMRAGRLSASAGGAAVSSPLLEAVTLDVRLLTDEDISVDNNYGRFQVGADVRVIGTAAAPSLAGRSELREGGRLFVGRNIYTIESGSFDFANPVTIDPDLDIDLRTRAAGQDIQVTIAGTSTSPSVDQQSLTEPELGRAEVASLLLTGRRLENLAPGDAAFVGTQVIGNFSGEVLGFASRAVGLDTIRLGGVDEGAVRRDPTAVATEIDPTTRLTFGKTLGSDVDITFSQSLRDSAAQTWIVDYRAARALELRLLSGDDDLRSYSFRHDLAFGGPERVTRPAAESAQSQQGRVATVSFSGDLAIPEQQLRAVLRLEPGDRFDFADWQVDRDRVEEVYHQEAYLTARVTPSRVDGPDGIDLEYRISAGPETRIRVTGMDLTPLHRARVETAWARSVFDDFLVDEVAEIVRSELAREDYLQPTVDVGIAGEDDVSILSVDVDRGDRFEQTVVLIDGASTPLADAISARLVERGVIAGAVLDGDAVESEVTGYLRSIGYVGARVTVGAPLFGAEQVVVPVNVDAGPAFSITRVVFEGAERMTDDALRGRAALAEGGRYDPVGTDAARDRLVAMYRSEGFPAATVSVRPDVGTDASVGVTFAISEGARQVLGEVVVAGNSAIDADVIVRAVDLPVNAPLRVTDLLQARARVFDTGLFRRVDVESEPGLSSDDGREVPVRLRVAVEEWPALRLRYGVQVQEEHPESDIERRDLVPGLSADLTRRTLFGKAIAVGGAVEWRRRERVGRVFLDTASLFGLPIGSSLVAERSRRDFTAVTLVTDRSSVTWGQRARVANHLSLSYAYTFERNHTFDTKPVDPDAFVFDITINIARLNAAVAWDSRNDPIETTRGTLASYSLEFAPEAVGSDIRFVRSVAQAYHFRPWRGLVFASAARAGVVVPLGGQDLIPSERFFAGGARTVRGVAEGGLGARDFFGDPAGGEVLAVFNQEVRLPIYRWLRGVGFLDAGNVFARSRDASLRSLVGSIGVGLRIASPFALLRADYARPIWGEPAGMPGRWSIGIGHAF